MCNTAVHESSPALTVSRNKDFSRSHSLKCDFRGASTGEQEAGGALERSTRQRAAAFSHRLGKASRPLRRTRSLSNGADFIAGYFPMEAAVSTTLSKMEAGRRAKAERKSQLKGQLAYNQQLKQMGLTLGSARANAALAEVHALELATGVQLDPETNQYKSVAGTMPAKKKAKEVLRRPMKQAAALLDAVPTRVAAAPLHGAARALSLHIDPTETKSPFYQETMENMLCKAGAKGITILKKPGERFPEERLGMRVRLDTGGAWQRHDERGEIVVEHLCKADLEQRFDDDGDSPLSFTGDVAPWFGRVSAQEYLEVEEYANEFHMRGIKKAKSTHDPLADDAWAIELGVSVYPGGRARLHAPVHPCTPHARCVRPLSLRPCLLARAQVGQKCRWQRRRRARPTS